MFSPSSSSTSRSTPCVLGCCGPMLTVIVSVRISGISPDPSPAPPTRTSRAGSSGALPASAAVSARARSRARPPDVRVSPPSRPVRPIVRSPLRARASQRRVHVRRRAARRDRQSRRRPARPSASTCRANTCVEPEVVGDARHHRRVGRQRHRRPAPRRGRAEPSHQFGREVLRVGRAAAVAEHQHLAARQQRFARISRGRLVDDRRRALAPARPRRCSAPRSRRTLSAAGSRSVVAVDAAASRRRRRPSPVGLRHAAPGRSPRTPPAVSCSGDHDAASLRICTG